MIVRDNRPGHPLTALYVLIDDHVLPSGQRGPGHPKKLGHPTVVSCSAATPSRPAPPPHRPTLTQFPGPKSLQMINTLS
jgi:hypothetical protein